MSMHKIPLTELERSGLIEHGLDIDKPSQLSDAFRLGIRYALDYKKEHHTNAGDIRCVICGAINSKYSIDIVHEPSCIWYDELFD